METKPKKLNKIINVVVNVLIVFVVLLALVFTIFGLTSRRSDQVPQIFGQGYLTVLSDSMDTPSDKIDSNVANGYECPKGFERGDILIVNTYKTTDLYNMLQEGEDACFKVGDIITFPAQINGALSYNTHRIIAVQYDDVNHTCSYLTQGDNTTGADGYINHLSVLASYKSKVSNVGHLFLFLQTGAGFFVCIVLPLLLLLGFEVFNFVKVYKEYRLEKYGPKVSKEQLDKEQENADLQKQIEELKRQLEEKNNSDE